MNLSDPHDALTSALRSVAREDRQLGVSQSVEKRLLQEVAAIRHARRSVARKMGSAAAILIVAVAGSVWSVRNGGSPPVAAIPDPRSPIPDPRSVEQTTEFFPLHYSDVPAADIQLVRLEVSRTALVSFGVDFRETPVNDAAATVLADVIVGSDGLARAIRFVWPPSDARLQEQRQ
jgi:hypothetical protein